MGRRAPCCGFKSSRRLPGRGSPQPGEDFQAVESQVPSPALARAPLSEGRYVTGGGERLGGGWPCGVTGQESLSDVTEEGCGPPICSGNTTLFVENGWEARWTGMRAGGLC